MPEMPDLNAILEAAQNAQAELQKAQDNLDKIEVEGASGGGLVFGGALAFAAAGAGSMKPEMPPEVILTSGVEVQPLAEPMLVVGEARKPFRRVCFTRHRRLAGGQGPTPRRSASGSSPSHPSRAPCGSRRREAPRRGASPSTGAPRARCTASAPSHAPARDARRRRRKRGR